jgi:hypothetical protein
MNMESTQVDTTQLAKEAYVIADQLREMQKSMDERKGAYHAYTRTYNRQLVRAKEILKLDPTIARTVEHLTSYDEHKESGWAHDQSQLHADLPILLSALRMFFEFNFPKQEKQKMGFV